MKLTYATIALNPTELLEINLTVSRAITIDTFSLMIHLIRTVTLKCINAYENGPAQ